MMMEPDEIGVEVMLLFAKEDFFLFLNLLRSTAISLNSKDWKLYESLFEDSI